jgi:hypothetical protein
MIDGELVDARSVPPQRGGAGNGIRTHAAQRGHRLSRPAHYPLCPRDVRQAVYHYPGVLSRHHWTNLSDSLHL